MVTNLINNHPNFRLDYDNEAIQQFMVYVHNTMHNDFFLGEAQNPPLLSNQLTYWQDDDFARFHLINKEYFTRLHLGSRGMERWGSTNNMLFRYHTYIRRWYPQCEWVMLRRDPRDNWASFSQHWHPDTADEVELHFEMFTQRTGMAMRFCDAGYPNVHVLEYHEVVQDPELVYRTLGIDVPKDYLRNAREILYNRSYGLSPQEAIQAVDEPIAKSRVGRWKRDLSETEVEWCKLAFPEECKRYDEIDGTAGSSLLG